jgi:hypothetical protein
LTRRRYLPARASRSSGRAALSLGTAGSLVYGRPGNLLGSFLAVAALFFALFNVARLSLLLCRISDFVSTGHAELLSFTSLAVAPYQVNTDIENRGNPGSQGNIPPPKMRGIQIVLQELKQHEASQWLTN